MEARVIKKDEMHFLGLEDVFASVADFDPDPVMFRRFIPQAAAFAPYGTDEVLYALGRTFEDGTCSYMVARRVEKLATIPSGVPDETILKTVSPSIYAEIKTTPKELGARAEEKVKKWLNGQEEYDRNLEGFEIECYPPDCKSAEDEMYLWIPLLNKKS